MKKIIKKVTSCFVAICLVVGSMFMLAGCGETEESRVMNVDVNPKLEFVLDSENKVVSVNALNDDGSCILQGEVDFTGLEAEDAVELFLDKAKEYGFVIETDTNSLTISVSGKNADKLLNDVKDAAEEHISHIGLQISVAKNTIKREALEKIVAECYQEYTADEINSLSDEELVNLIKKSREETKNLLTQELKDLYYAERAEAVMEAKIAEIKKQVSVSKQLAVVALETAYSALNNIYDQVQEAYTTAMSSLSEKMESYIEIKKQYIEARKAGDEELVSSLSNSLLIAENALTQARTVIDNQIGTIKAQLDQVKDVVVSSINELIEGLDTTKIENAINSARVSVETTIKTDYASINVNLWVSNVQ